MFANKNIEIILRDRERRVIYQKKLIKEYKNTLITFKLNIPGPKKDSLLYRKIFNNGLKLLKATMKEYRIPIIFQSLSFKNTGPEAFLVVKAKAHNMKKLCVNIEEKDGLGRIYDFDVFDSSGNSIGRKLIGIPERKCFLCDKCVWLCARSRAHSLEEMLEYIEVTAKAYFK